ncbi:hypothetical protein [Streptomyces sp. KL118A]
MALTEMADGNGHRFLVCVGSEELKQREERTGAAGSLEEEAQR